MKKIFLYSLIALSFACTKLVDMPITNGPQFETAMIITRNNVTDTIQIAAGEEDAYYNAYTETRNGVKVFVGEFVFESGTKKLKFEYFDHSKPYEFSDGITFFNNETDFADFSSPFIGYLNFDSSSVVGQNISNIDWFVDGVQYNQATQQITEPGIYDVELVLEFGGTYISKLKNKVYLGFENPCWGYFTSNPLGGGEFEFHSVVQNSTANVEWILNDTEVYQQNDLIVSLGSGVHKVQMHVTDGEGHEYFRERNIGFNGNHYVEAFNFVKLNSKDLHNTLIVSYEEDGVVYSSKHLVQQNPLLNIGTEKHIMETASDIVVNYPIEMEFQMLDPTNPTTSFTTVSLTGKIGFQVEK
ncbi:MAG: hypothetical protein KDC84_02790 [Crocinitomicaceae bacterium]|nr:hypothetical protein [Crocinitomicaceae bacterium]